MAAVSMEGNMKTQHERVAEERWSWKTSDTGEEPQMYRMAFLAKGVPQRCLVEGCPGRMAMRTAMRVHFIHRHVRDTIVVFEEGNLPHPR